jgi:hypothetical protein
MTVQKSDGLKPGRRRIRPAGSTSISAWQGRAPERYQHPVQKNRLQVKPLPRPPLAPQCHAIAA